VTFRSSEVRCGAQGFAVLAGRRLASARGDVLSTVPDEQIAIRRLPSSASASNPRPPTGPSTRHGHRNPLDRGE